MPSCTRPARPRRCLAEARETHTSSSEPCGGAPPCEAATGAAAGGTVREKGTLNDKDRKPMQMGEEQGRGRTMRRSTR